MKAPTLAAAAVFLLATAASARWLETEYNFGTWEESEGLREGVARVVNDTDSAMVVRRVRPSCGCTGVDYPQNEIAPGDTARIIFNYNPEGRPGPFDKTIRVWLNQDAEPQVIRIRGTVVGAGRSLFHRYPFAAESFRLSDSIIALGHLEAGNSAHTFISGYNSSRHPITPKIVFNKKKQLPVEVNIRPATVPPGETFVIAVDLGTETNTKLYGPQSQPFEVVVGDGRITPSVDVTILPPHVTVNAAKLAEAPEAVLSPSAVELGNVKPGVKKEFTITVSNAGHSTLQLHRIYSLMSGLTVGTYPTKLKPGKTAKIKCTFVAPTDCETASDRNILSGKIGIISSDPVNPVKEIKIGGILQNTDNQR